MVPHDAHQNAATREADVHDGTRGEDYLGQEYTVTLTSLKTRLQIPTMSPLIFVLSTGTDPTVLFMSLPGNGVQG